MVVTELMLSSTKTSVSQAKLGSERNVEVKSFESDFDEEKQNPLEGR